MAERKFPDWATDTVNLANGDPNKEDPGLVKQALGWIVEKPLVQFANWRENLVGHFIRANNEVKTVADTYEAEAGEIVLLDNSAGAVTGYLPANPVDGQWVEFGSVELYSIFGVTIDGNGKDIMVAATTGVTLDLDSAMYIFNYDLDNDIWKINLGMKRGKV